MSKNFILTTLLVSGMGVVIIFAPTESFAARVHFTVTPNVVATDTATIVEVRLNPEDKSINAIDGILQLQTDTNIDITSVIVETGGSMMTLWPQTPHYSTEDGVIRFTGGTPQGVSKEGLLFRIRIFTSKQGTVSFSWIGGSAYLDDGRGTAEPISSRSITISLTPNTPNPINPSSIDSVPPYFDTVEVGKDQDVFDGKYFISFHATDDLSGIDHYEVAENQIVTKIKNEVYVLQDQERKSRVILTAYDKAGNSVSVKVPTKYAQVINISTYIAIFVVGILVLFRKKLFVRIKAMFKKS